MIVITVLLSQEREFLKTIGMILIQMMKMSSYVMTVELILTYYN